MAEKKWLKLRPYDENDKDNFHGRDREVIEIVNTLRNSILITITGKSGVGKTSLIRAGILPKLRKEYFFPVYIRFNPSFNDYPFEKQIIDAIENSAKEKNVLIRAISPKINEEESLWEFFHRNEFWDEFDQLLTPVCVLDQLGELFDEENDKEKKIKKQESVSKFFKELSNLCTNSIPDKFIEKCTPKFLTNVKYSFETINYKIILSLRDDYLDKLAAFEEVIPALKKNLFFIQQLNGEQARKIIRKVEGLGFSKKQLDGDDRSSDDKLAEIIIRKISNNEDTKIPLKQIKIKPAILSLFMGELHEKREIKNLGYISRELVELFGKNIIEDFYSRAMRRTSFLRIKHSRCTRLIEKELITSQGKRKTAAIDGDVKISTKHLDFLKQQNILNTILQGEVTYVEYTHDVLLDPAIKNKEERLKKIKRLENFGMFIIIIVFFVSLWCVSHINSNIRKNLISEEIEREMSMPIIKIDTLYRNMNEDTTLMCIKNDTLCYTLMKDTFHMGMYAVTQKQFFTIMEYNPSIKMVGLINNKHTTIKKIVTWLMDGLWLKNFKINGFWLSEKEKEEMAIGSDISVQFISWEDAVSFINKLNKINKDTTWYYTLPTTDEWQYAAAGGLHLTWDDIINFSKKIIKINNYKNKIQKIESLTKEFPKGFPIKTKYSGSNDINEVAWHFKTSSLKVTERAKKEPNGYGLYDMSGNVWEWCLNEDKTDTTKRAVMGGSFLSKEAECEISKKNITHVRCDIAFDDAGFRIIKKKRKNE